MSRIKKIMTKASLVSRKCSHISFDAKKGGKEVHCKYMVKSNEKFVINSKMRLSGPSNVFLE